MTESFQPEPAKPSGRKAVIAIVSLTLFLLSLFALISFGTSPVSASATTCKITDLNEQPTNSGTFRRIYAEGCNGNPENRMFYLSLPDPRQEPELYASIKIGKEYDFETTHPRWAIFGGTESIRNLAPSE